MTDYYVNASTGDDGNAGTTTGTAWQTADKAGQESWAMVAGDTINFNGGDTFVFSSKFTISGDNSLNPIILQSYGTGKATLSSAQPNGLEIRGSGGKGCQITNLIITSSTIRRNYGIFAIAPWAGTIEIDNCDFYNTRNTALIQVPNLHFHDNRVFGSDSTPMLFDGGASQTATDTMVIEDNYSIGSGYANGSGSHAIYIAAASAQNNVTVRNNTLINTRNMGDNRGVNDPATYPRMLPPGSGSSTPIIVAHGDIMTDYIIENNHIIEEPHTPREGCYGISMSANTSEEKFVDLIVRNNIVENYGNRGIDVAGAKGVKIYNNTTTHSGDVGGTVDGHFSIRVGELRGVTSTGAEVHENIAYYRSAIQGTHVFFDASTEVTTNENNHHLVYSTPLNFNVLQAPTKGYLMALSASGGFTYVSEVAAPDTDTFTYRIWDSNYKSTEETVTMTIAA